MPVDSVGVLPEFVAVIVTYRRPQTLALHIQALGDSTAKPSHLIIIDNSPEGAKAGHSVVAPMPTTYIAPGENLGPAGGIHYGIMAALDLAERWEWVLLLDDDDPPRTKEVISDLLHMAAHQPGSIGAVGLVGGTLRPFTAALRTTLECPQSVLPCDYLGGGYLPLYRRAAVEPSSPFDPSLFFGFEELGAGLELKCRGFGLVAATDLAHEHGYGNDTSKARLPSFAREYYSTRNFLLLSRRYFPRRLPIVFARQFLGVIRFRPVLSRRQVLRARSLAWWHFCRGRGGRQEFR